MSAKMNPVEVDETLMNNPVNVLPGLRLQVTKSTNDFIHETISVECAMPDLDDCKLAMDYLLEKVRGLK